MKSTEMGSDRALHAVLTKMLLVVGVLMALVSENGPVYAQTCRWEGTAPYCAGECGPGETEEARAAVTPSIVTKPSVNHFGNGCVFGTKALCCETPGQSCRWDGTAPFCAGECNSDEGEVKRCDSCGGSGKACWTGTKALCCKATGSAGQPLQASPELTQYAAIWVKSSGPAWEARHGMSSAKYQQEFDALSKKGYRLVDISGYAVAGKDYYAAIWDKGIGPARVARHGMTSAQYQEEFEKLAKQGYQVVRVSGYGVGAKDYYAAIWEKSAGPGPVARHRMTSAQYQEEFDEHTTHGYRLVHVSGYSVAGSDYYAAIWKKLSGPGWTARHRMTSAQYQDAFNDLGQKGYRLVHISGYGIGGKSHYAAIWEQGAGPDWVARHGMTSDGYQEEFYYQAKDGYRLVQVSGFHPYY